MRQCIVQFVLPCLLQSLIHHLWLGYPLDGAIYLPRIHHQLVPNEVAFEPGFPQVRNLLLLNDMKAAAAYITQLPWKAGC